MSESSKEVDNRLVQELKAGNIEAFDKIVELYQRKIYALSFNITRNQMDAEDVAQDVLLSIYNKIDTFQGKAAFSSWVYRITLNATYMKLRSKKKDKTRRSCPLRYQYRLLRSRRCSLPEDPSGPE